MAPVTTCVGIDLGTTVCRTALAGSDGAASVANRFGSRRLPVAVALPAGETGNGAADGTGLRFEGLKQQIGVVDRVAGLHGPAPVVNELAEVMRQVREDILAAHEGEIAGAVATVPGFWPERARAVMRNAMWRAGWQAVRLVDEAIAAVLGQAGGKPEPGTVLVCALGAGLCCATVVKVEGQTPRMLAVEGDRGVGGFAFDAVLVRVILEKLYADGAPEIDESAALRLQALAEQVKVGLSRRDAAEFDPGPAAPDGAAAGKTVTVSRAEFEAGTGTLIARTVELCVTAAEHAGVGEDGISRILFVGEATAMPAVEQAVTRRFPRPFRHAPAGAAAQGAALYGQLLSADDWRVQQEAPAEFASQEPPAAAPPEWHLPDLHAPDQAAAGPRTADSWLGVFSGPIVEAQELWKTDRAAAIRRFRDGLTQASELLGTLIKNVADELVDAGHYGEAVKWLRHANAQSPGDAHIRRLFHYALGRYARELYTAGKFLGAHEVIQESLDLDPRCAGCRKAADTIDAAIKEAVDGLFRAGRGSEALGSLKLARARDPRDEFVGRLYHAALRRHARVLCEAGDFNRAREAVRQGPEADRRCPECSQVAAEIEVAIRRARQGRGGFRDNRRGRR